MEQSQKLAARAKAWAAATRHGMPARHMPVIAITGRDGGATTAAYLAQILKAAGERVGIITSEYVEIAGEQAKGSDQAHIFDDAFRLQSLLAQMRRAKCRYAIMVLPSQLPQHHFTAIPFSLLVVRRTTDEYLDQVTAAAAVAQLQSLLRRDPSYVILPRDEPAFDDLFKLTRIESRISYGTDERAESRITNVQMHPKGSAVRLTIDHQTGLDLTSRLTSKQVIYSLTAAATAAYVLHIPLEHIEAGVAKLPPQPATCEYLALDRPYQIVLDGSLTPSGIAEVLESLKHFAKNRLIAVVSASLAQPTAWRSVVGEVVADIADRVIVTDGDYTNEESPQVVRAQLLEGVGRANKEAVTEEIADREKALEKALSIARRGDTIVLCCVTTRPYRQVGIDRQAWDDRAKIKALV